MENYSVLWSFGRGDKAVNWKGGTALGLRKSTSRDLHFSQNWFSPLEHSDIEHTHLDPLRRKVETVGGQLRVEAEIGDRRIQIA